MREPLDLGEGAFVALMRGRRTAAGLSQDEFARRMRALGFTSWQQSTVAKVEANERPLKLREALAVTNLLDTTVPQMVSRRPDLSDAFARALRASVDTMIAEQELADAQARIADLKAKVKAAKSAEAKAADELEALTDAQGDDVTFPGEARGK